MTILKRGIESPMLLLCFFYGTIQGECVREKAFQFHREFFVAEGVSRAGYQYKEFLLAEGPHV